MPINIKAIYIALNSFQCFLLLGILPTINQLKLWFRVFFEVMLWFSIMCSIIMLIPTNHYVMFCLTNVIAKSSCSSKGSYLRYRRWILTGDQLFKICVWYSWLLHQSLKIFFLLSKDHQKSALRVQPFGYLMTNGLETFLSSFVSLYLP